MRVRVAGLVLCLLAAIGCGADSDADKPALTDHDWWVMAFDNGYDCAMGAHFGPDDRYELRIACALEGGGLGIQVERGRYALHDDEVTYTPLASSCPDKSTERTSEWWAIDDGQLIIGSDEGMVTLDPYTDETQAGHNGSGSSAGFYGCWDGPESFTRSPIVQL